MPGNEELTGTAAGQTPPGGRRDQTSATAAARGARRRETVTAWALRIGTLVVFAGLWELSARGTDNALIPTFVETVRGFVDLLVVGGQLWEPLLVSNQAMVLGYAIAVVVAVPWGMAAGRFRWLDRVSNPYVGIILAVPIAPLMPIVITAMGLGLASRVMIVVLFSFIYITVNTRAGIRSVDRSLVEMAHSFGAREAQIWRDIILPGAMPGIFTGLRIGLSRAVTGMVIVELLLVASGIGRLVLEFSARLQAGLLFGTVLAVVLEALILLSIMDAVRRRVAPWAHDSSVR